MQKKKLLIDVDDTICESVALKTVNNFLNTNYIIDDFKNFFIDDIIPPDQLEAYFIKYFETDPYENLPLIKGAKEALEKLSEKYEIYICSSCIFDKKPLMSAKLFLSKFNYIVKNLPFIKPENIIFTASKNMIRGDILIDDYFHNFKDNLIETKLLFNSYHNKQITDEMLKARGVKRVKDWDEILKILL